jgi:hypothetical protein
MISVGGYADLQSTTTVHFVEGLLEIVEFEFISHHSLSLDFSAIQVRDSTREAVRLREGTDDLSKQFLSIIAV